MRSRLSSLAVLVLFGCAGLPWGMLVAAAQSPPPSTAAPHPQPLAGSRAPCLEAGSDQGVVQGRLGLQEGFGPAAFIVVVPQGVCLTGTDPADRVEAAYSVQLFSNTAEGFQDLYRLAGEKVYVRGRALGARTFQQRAPILLEVIEIATN